MPRSEEAEHLEHAVPRARRELAAVRREVDRRVEIDELLRITLQYAGEDATWRWHLRGLGPRHRTRDESRRDLIRDEKKFLVR